MNKAKKGMWVQVIWFLGEKFIRLEISLGKINQKLYSPSAFDLEAIFGNWFSDGDNPVRLNSQRVSHRYDGGEHLHDEALPQAFIQRQRSFRLKATQQRQRSFHLKATRPFA